LLGELYLFNQRAPREADLAESNFMEATKYRETTIPAHYRLGRLYQQGYLSRPDPKKSLDNFLYAARRRVTAADTHLARLFYDSPGTRIDRVNAYVFAKLSQEAGYPVLVRTLRGGTLNVYNLLDRLKTDLTAPELDKAEAMYLKEREVHLITPRPIGPEIWMPGAAG
jgi:TPR repeat protein